MSAQQPSATPSQRISLELRSISRFFEDVRAVQDISLRIGAGEFVTLLGASGSGKTTTLMIIAGFQNPDSGDVLIDGRDVTRDPPYRRNLGLVYQHYALFPNMTVAGLFDVDLVELENPGCTGAREFRAISEHLHLTANGRILALAERLGHDLVAVCDTCLLNLVETNRRLKTDGRSRATVNRALAGEGLTFEGKIEVKHFLWVLTEDLGEHELQQRIVRPLRDLRVAPFYGCHIQRPASVYGADVSDQTPALDRLCTLLGAKVVQYQGANKCCGFHVVGTEEKIAVRMSGSHLTNAKSNGAQCIVTPCPLCHTVFDAYQPSIKREFKGKYEVPVLHVSQLVGLALGLSAEAIGLARHVVGCDSILAHISYGGSPDATALADAPGGQASRR